MEIGYYAALQVSFGASEQEIAKAYKKRALRMHPDKHPDNPNAVDDFQRLTTAYHVLADPDKRRAYNRLFVLRCYMAQSVPAKDEPMRPYFAFVVEKLGKSVVMGSKSELLLTFDLLEHMLRVYKKDNLQSELPLSAILAASAKDEQSPGAKTLEISVTLGTATRHSEEVWLLRCRSSEQFDTLYALLRRVVNAAASEHRDAALNVAMDDVQSPPAALFKSKVIKRADKLGGSLLHDWQPRFMVAGSSQLLLFRDVELEHLVNVIPTQPLTLSIDKRDGTCFQLIAPYWKASFRVISQEVRYQWHEALQETKRVAAVAAVAARAASPAATVCVSENALGRQPLPVAAPPPLTVPPSPIGRPTRPSVVFTDVDLANLDAAVLPTRRSESAQGLTGAARAEDGGPLPYEVNYENAAPDVSEGGGNGGWHESEGVPPRSNLATAVSFSGKAEPEDVRRAQLEALRDEELPLGEGGSAAAGAPAAADAPPSRKALAQAKGSLLAAMQEIDRGVQKARRAVEAERPVGDVAALLMGLTQMLDNLNDAGREYGAVWARRPDDEERYLKSRGTYLKELQAEVLGRPETTASREQDSVAAKLFRKCAYVADSALNPKTAPLRTRL